MIAPPLIVDAAEIDYIVNNLRNALNDVLKSL